MASPHTGLEEVLPALVAIEAVSMTLMSDLFGSASISQPKEDTAAEKPAWTHIDAPEAPAAGAGKYLEVAWSNRGGNMVIAQCEGGAVELSRAEPGLDSLAACLPVLFRSPDGS